MSSTFSKNFEKNIENDAVECHHVMIFSQSFITSLVLRGERCRTVFLNKTLTFAWLLLSDVTFKCAMI